MATHQFSRTTAHLKRAAPAHARSSKANTPSRRVSYQGPSKAAVKAAPSKEEDFEDEESMATSFLNFCATCEKQIIVPNNSVLYCSESCRKKDTDKALTFSFPMEPSLPPAVSPGFDNDAQFRDIVPPRCPTAPPSKRSSMVLPGADHSPLPKEERLRRESEATLYLRQFQSVTNATMEPSARHHRPRYGRASISTSTVYSPAPSLSTTPASSVGHSMPYTPSSTRPLPRRTNTDISSYGSRSIDLVTPFTAATTVATTPPSPTKYSLKSCPVVGGAAVAVVAEGEIRYEKRILRKVDENKNGSLKKLFAETPTWA